MARVRGAPVEGPAGKLVERAFHPSDRCRRIGREPLRKRIEATSSASTSISEVRQPIRSMSSAPIVRAVRNRSLAASTPSRRAQRSRPADW